MWVNLELPFHVVLLYIICNTTQSLQKQAIAL